MSSEHCALQPVAVATFGRNSSTDFPAENPETKFLGCSSLPDSRQWLRDGGYLLEVAITAVIRKH